MVERMSNLLDSVGAEWILWLLLILSVASVAIIIERWFFLRRRKINIEALTRQLTQAKSNTEDMLAALGNGPAMELAVGRALITHRDRPRKALEDLYAAAVERERLQYERGIGYLATLGSNSPFIGLLGTVIGIIAAFAEWASSDKIATNGRREVGAWSASVGKSSSAADAIGSRQNHSGQRIASNQPWRASSERASRVVCS